MPPWSHGGGLGRSEWNASCCSSSGLVVGADMLQGSSRHGPLVSILKNRKKKIISLHLDFQVNKGV